MQPHLPALSMPALEQSVVAGQLVPRLHSLGPRTNYRLECGFPPVRCKATKPAALASIGVVPVLLHRASASLRMMVTGHA